MLKAYYRLYADSFYNFPEYCNDITIIYLLYEM